MKGQKLLKVTSILMIIGGVIAAIVGVLAILGISALVALAESAEGAGLLYASSAIIIVSSIIEFIAGIKGVGACSAPQKAAACVKWGIVIGILYIASMVIGLIGGGQFSIINLVLNLLLPGLYSYGAVQMKNNVNFRKEREPWDSLVSCSTKRSVPSAAARSDCSATESWRTAICAKAAPPSSHLGSATDVRVRWMR